MRGKNDVFGKYKEFTFYIELNVEVARIELWSDLRTLLKLCLKENLHVLLKFFD